MPAIVLPTVLVEAVERSASPAAVSLAISRLTEEDVELADRLEADFALREALVAVVGASRSLTQLCLTDPAAIEALANAPVRAPCPAEDADALVRWKRLEYLRIAAVDLTAQASLETTAASLAQMAEDVFKEAWRLTSGDPLRGDGPAGIAVIAMGKFGGRELNYASDVDVMFVGRGDVRPALDIARRCFRVDADLRPEGRNGPLVRTLDAFHSYWSRWAKTWEFQALLKARLAAGDPGLGADYLAAVGPMVWAAAQRTDFVSDVQAMRRRVLGSLPAAQAGRELKLGPGGLRDIEFAVQLLQLVHGRTDESLRVPGTLDALGALAAGGYVGRGDAASLAAAYQFLRCVEHLLQLRRLRRTHTLPEDRAVLRQVGRALRLMQGAARGGAPGDPADELIAQWRQHASQARQLHEKLFYRPLLDAVARLPGEAARLTPAAAAQRLEALGYADPAGALRHIESLSAGVSRKAAIQRTLLPVLLGWFADAPQPDAGLLAFRQVSEALGNSPWYLRLLRDNTLTARRMAQVLASSRYATGLLLRAPEAVGMLADIDELASRPADALLAEALAAVHRHDSAADAAGAVLAIRRRELLRTAMAYVLGLTSVQGRGEALTTVAAVTVAAALDAAVREAEQASGPLPTRLAVIAMGRFGGREMGFASDADVMFVHDPVPGASEEAASRAAHAVAENLRALLATPRPDPALQIDAGLRPEGRQGPLVRTLASYRAYYRRWSLPWEAQALLRAGFVAGDRGVGDAFIAMADEIRYPDGGIPDDSVREIRRIKARVEAERMPRGMDRALNLKLGPGGLSDVEWVAQLIQLRHAHAVPSLRTTGTLTALQAASSAGLVTAPDLAALTAAWQLAARIRDGVMLMRGRGSDALPTATAELAIVARLLGYPPDGSQQLAEDWRRASRHARSVMDRLFYG